MLEELENIDVSTIDDLRTTKEKQQVLRDRLEAMEGRKEEVSETVYARVRSDYSASYERLEEEARPLKSRARAEYAKLMVLLNKLEDAVETARLAREEVEFRHELGEFEDGDFEARKKECDQQVAQCEGDLTDGQKLKERFVEAFHSEEELLEDAETLPPVPPPEPESEESGAVEEATSETTVPDELRSEPEQVDGGEGAEPAGEEAEQPVEPEATVMQGLPRLVATKEDGTEEVYNLSPTGTSIGRLDSNDVCVPDLAVSRQHAKIDLTTAGFTVFDLDSENGVFVNGERKKEHLLKDGDRLVIGGGTQEFVFHDG